MRKIHLILILVLVTLLSAAMVSTIRTSPSKTSTSQKQKAKTSPVKAKAKTPGKKKAVVKKTTVEKSSIPPALKGSSKSMIRQNEMAKKDKLPYYKNMAEVRKAVKKGELVRLSSSLFKFDKNLPKERRYVTPQAKRLAENRAKLFKAKFKTVPTVTSMVRPVDVQKNLKGGNGNAAKTTGKKRSTHPTGSALDITYKGMSRSQIKWWQDGLVSIETKQKTIEATQERHQPCFHIFTGKDYGVTKKKKG